MISSSHMRKEIDYAGPAMHASMSFCFGVRFENTLVCLEGIFVSEMPWTQITKAKKSIFGLRIKELKASGDSIPFSLVITLIDTMKEKESTCLGITHTYLIILFILQK